MTIAARTPIDRYDVVLAVARGGFDFVGAHTFADGRPERPFGSDHQSDRAWELGRCAVEDDTAATTFHVHTGPRTGWWIGPRGMARG